MVAVASFYMFGNASKAETITHRRVCRACCMDRLSDLTCANIVPVFFNFEEEGCLGRRHSSRLPVQEGEGDSKTKHAEQSQTLLGQTAVLVIDPDQAYMINFDCVGRGTRYLCRGIRD